eukprot:14576713-Alexandrium_andersonii.AAC.1
MIAKACIHPRTPQRAPRKDDEVKQLTPTSPAAQASEHPAPAEVPPKAPSSASPAAAPDLQPAEAGAVRVEHASPPHFVLPPAR